MQLFKVRVEQCFTDYQKGYPPDMYVIAEDKEQAFTKAWNYSKEHPEFTSFGLHAIREIFTSLIDNPLVL